MPMAKGHSSIRPFMDRESQPPRSNPLAGLPLIPVSNHTLGPRSTSPGGIPGLLIGCPRHRPSSAEPIAEPSPLRALMAPMAPQPPIGPARLEWLLTLSERHAACMINTRHRLSSMPWPLNMAGPLTWAVFDVARSRSSPSHLPTTTNSR